MTAIISKISQNALLSHKNNVLWNDLQFNWPVYVRRSTFQFQKT